MELTARYGLEFNPFLKNSHEVLYQSSEYSEASFRLDYLAKTKGFRSSYRTARQRKNYCCEELVLGVEPFSLQGDLHLPFYCYSQ